MKKKLIGKKIIGKSNDLIQLIDRKIDNNKIIKEDGSKKNNNININKIKEEESKINKNLNDLKIEREKTKNNNNDNNKNINFHKIFNNNNINKNRKFNNYEINITNRI